MAKTILVCGFGPGISTGVAEAFGAGGFQVALVARSADKLEAGVKSLASKGVHAAAFQADLGDPESAPGLVERVRSSLGPLTAIHWNAYGGGAGDLLTADVAAIHKEIDLAVTTPLKVVSAALPDLQKAAGAAVLLTNGGFGKIAEPVDAMGVKFNAMGLSLANAAKDKLAGLLSEKLKAHGIYVGQLTIMGMVKGTGWDRGDATVDPKAVGAKFWSLYEARSPVRVDFG